ncbi:MAG: hypothetical protein J6T23_06080 [Elusimicrobia bacterium]|nr:hypothetical protein [Elusimicrobiota bacterium]
MEDILDIYLSYCEDVIERLKEESPKNREQVYEIVEEIRDDVISKIELAFDDIAYDYCHDNEIYDE